MKREQDHGPDYVPVREEPTDDETTGFDQDPGGPDEERRT
jgi:hypothetical protein